MIIPRRIKALLSDLDSFYPIISLTGPRQAGKTTTLRELYSSYRYVSLENPSVLAAAKRDPESFLSEYSDQVIFDEAQRFPALFSYLQGMVDERREPGRFILSGSQNFLLRRTITQSLAGRVGVAKLLPLDLCELREANQLPMSPWETIFRGAYPELVNKGYSATRFYDSYVQTYLERDVTELINYENLPVFLDFLRSCATLAGQMVNLSKLANETNISVPTAKSWIGILEQSYILFRLQPFYRNLGKRLTKTPKLYFYDTGLACFLLGLSSVADLERYDRRGALFENLMIADAHKSSLHTGIPLRYYFYRNTQKQEVDLIYETALEANFWEIKAGERFRSNMTNTLEAVASKWDRPVNRYLIYDGEEEVLKGKTQLLNWRNISWTSK